MDNQQSIIVNFNPHFANGDASDFTQPFNKQLEIPPNSEVAFYQGQLQRKTIVIPKTETISVNYVEQLPTDDFREKVSDATFSKIDNSFILPKLGKDAFQVKKGSYTQSEFVEEIRSNLALNATENREDAYNNNTGIDFMYQAVGENDAEGVFISYAPLNQPISIGNTGNVGSEVALNNGSFITETAQTFRPNTQSDNWNTFLTTQYPMNPLSAIQTTYPAKQDDNQNIVFYDIDFNPLPSTTQRIYVGFINDAYTSSLWTTATQPQIYSAFPDYPTLSDGVPESFIGVEYRLDTDSSNTSTITGKIFVNDLFSNRLQYAPEDQFEGAYDSILEDNADWNQVFSAECLQRVYTWKVDGSFIPRQGIRIYSLTEKSGIEDPDGLETQETRNYYFQVLSKTYNDNGFYGVKGGDNVLFDSKDFGVYLPQRLVEDASAAQSYISDRDPAKRQFLGIKPYFFMRNCSTNTYIYDPRATTIVQRLSDNNSDLVGQPIVRYNFEFPIDSVIRDILGTGRSYQDITKVSNEEARFDPNIYPQSRGRQAGINALYSDNQRYNFEIESLPIRTFNSTKSSQNISGNERTIIHSTESFIEGETTELKNSFLNKNVVPSNMKFISLNNKQKILLNDISVKITRADTNIIADEITDTSFEMIIRNKQRE